MNHSLIAQAVSARSIIRIRDNGRANQNSRTDDQAKEIVTMTSQQLSASEQILLAAQQINRINFINQGQFAINNEASAKIIELSRALKKTVVRFRI